MYAPDFDCDPYHNPTIYDTNPNYDTTIYEQLILTQTINVPFHEFAKRTNMNLSTTGKQKDDTSHPTVHQADEDHDTEITVLVTPPSENIKSILKNYFNPLPTGLQSPQKLPVATNEIQEAMTLSPSSRESPEHKNVGQIAPKTAMKPGTILEGHNLQQHHVHASIPKSLHDSKDVDWFHTNQQLNGMDITSPASNEKCVPIFSAITLKRRRNMLFALLDLWILIISV